MSIGSFFDSVGAEIKKLFKSVTNATWEQKATGAIALMAPLIEELAQLTGGTPAAAIVTAIVTKLQSSLATVSVLAKQGTPVAGSSTAVTIETALTAINENMAAILADADIKNSSKISTIEGIANTITGETNALISGLTTTS